MAKNSGSDRAADALLEESLEELYEQAPCGYTSILPDGRFVKVNQTLLDWLGYEREAVLGGMRFHDLLSIAGKIYFETHLAPLLAMQGFANEIAFDLVCRDRRTLPVLINAVLKRDDEGKSRIIRITIFNATDRRRYERELNVARRRAEQALELRDQFLSLASHELKTPLTGILGNVQLLMRRVLREQSMNERDRATLQVIIDQTKRLNKMVVSLLDVSRIETGQLSIERAPVEVSVLVRRVIEEAQPILNGHDVHVEAEDGPFVIQGDELRLEQVFQNLFQNAVKYSEPPATVRAVVRAEADKVLVDVQDSGIGIPSSALPHLFERFYRAENVHMGNVSGMGIGLYVVKQIVDLHGGEISVRSVEGQGSTFTVALPIAPAAA